MILIHIIDVIGYSGSGKTTFITTIIKSLKAKFNYNIAVIKNVKHHSIDEEGKDSYYFTKAGATYSVIRNVNNETAVFMECKDSKLNDILEWLKNGPTKINIIITEGFRNLGNPTVLCISNFDDIEEQLTTNVRMITGVICSKDLSRKSISNLPILNIEKQFQEFTKLFNIN
ncbi:MAG: molybdopterin-guanine dinucleotide biosynthesis protein B [Promethearchaeota archaeon]